MEINWSIVFKVLENIVPVLSLVIAILAIYSGVRQTKLNYKLQFKNKWIDDLRTDLSEFLVTSDLAISSYKQYYRHSTITKDKVAENKYYYAYEDAVAKKSFHYFRIAMYFDLKLEIYKDLNEMLNEVNVHLMGDNIRKFISFEEEAKLFGLFDKIGRKANEVIRYVEKN